MTTHRTEIFIDGSNFFATAKLLGLTIDYKELRNYLRKTFPGLIRINYYTALLQEDDEQIKLKPLVDWMAYNEYNLVTKPAKRHENTDGSTFVKGNMDVEIAVDMLNAASYATEMVLFSGDGDFISVVEYLQKKGVVVIIASSIKTSPRLCADSLRKKADKFIELQDIADSLTKKWVEE